MVNNAAIVKIYFKDERSKVPAFIDLLSFILKVCFSDKIVKWMCGKYSIIPKMLSYNFKLTLAYLCLYKTKCER